MWIGVISLFPEMFKAITEFGVTGRAVKHNLLQVECWNPRDFTFDKHKTVDDRPYGGGPGMLMMVQPLRDAIHAAKAGSPPHKINFCGKTLFILRGIWYTDICRSAEYAG